MLHSSEAKGKAVEDMSIAMIEEVKALQNDVISWRRHLHKHAEISFKEFETSNYIENELNKIGGIEISRPLPTGVIGIIEGAYPGKTIALRADIDALPMKEDNDLDFASVNDGAMHSCGHDGHAAMLLGVAKLFASKKEQMHGKLICIFQHAEELPPGGAVEMVEKGIMDGVDEISVCTCLPISRQEHSGSKAVCSHLQLMDFSSKLSVRAVILLCRNSVLTR